MKLKVKIEKCVREHLNTEDTEYCQKKYETELNQNNLQSLLKKPQSPSSKVAQYLQAPDYNSSNKADSANNLKLQLNSNLFF